MRNTTLTREPTKVWTLFDSVIMPTSSKSKNSKACWSQMSPNRKEEVCPKEKTNNSSYSPLVDGANIIIIRESKTIQTFVASLASEDQETEVATNMIEVVEFQSGKDDVSTQI